MRTPKKKPKLSTDVSAEDFKELGAKLMKRPASGSEKVFYERWTAFFYAGPEACERAWSLLAADADGVDPDAPDDKIGEPVHVLWALMLLKTYGTEVELSSICGVDEDTFRKWAWHYIEKISYLEDEVVSDHGVCFRLCTS